MSTRGIVFFAVFAASLSAIAMLGQPSSPASPNAAQAFKNIQVLKDTPANELIPTMQFISASLGVRCEHCHVEREFDKDDKKPKQMARKMMQMTFALNQDNFKGEREVTCYSCHRGNLHPATIPAVATGFAAPPQKSAPPATSSQSPDAILTRYLQAVGGTAALDKLNTQIEKGQIDVGNGVQFELQVYTKYPELRSVITQFPNGAVSKEILNGNHGWSVYPGRPPEAMTPSELLAAHLDADLRFAANARNTFSKWEVQPDTMIDGRAVDAVQASNPGLPPVEFYFAKDTGLLVRSIRYVDTPLGLNPTQIDYSDYREVAGSKVAYQLVISQPQGQRVIHFSDVQRNLPIEEARFAAPSTAISGKQ